MTRFSIVAMLVLNYYSSVSAQGIREGDEISPVSGSQTTEYQYNDCQNFLYALFCCISLLSGCFMYVYLA